MLRQILTDLANTLREQGFIDEREAFIENFAINSLVLTFVKIGIYTGSGLFPVDLWLIFLIGIPVTFIATRGGQWLTPRIPKEKFIVGVLAILAVMAVRFVVMALEDFLC